MGAAASQTRRCRRREVEKNEAVARQTIGLAGTLATFSQRKRSRAVKGLQQHAARRIGGGRGLERDGTYLSCAEAE